MPGYFKVNREEKRTRDMVKQMQQSKRGGRGGRDDAQTVAAGTRRVRISYEDKLAAQQLDLDRNEVSELSKWELKTGNQLDSDEYDSDTGGDGGGGAEEGAAAAVPPIKM